MKKILRELTVQIVGLYYAAEMMQSAECKKAADEVSKSYNTILSLSKEAKKIFKDDREFSKKNGFTCNFSTVEEMKKRALLMAKEEKDNQHDADSSETQADRDNYNHFYNR